MRSAECSLRRQCGYTLTELMITVLIVAVLASVALPSYLEQTRKTRRSDAQAALMQAAQALERCYTLYNAYDSDNCPALSDGALAAGYTSSEGGYYALSLPTLTATTYTLSAKPQEGQSNDKCGTLTLDQSGVRDVVDADSGVTAADCW